jgi:hypothetical protein
MCMTFRNFPGISDLLSKVSKFQHHTKPFSKCSALLVSTVKLSPMCWRKRVSYLLNAALWRIAMRNAVLQHSISHTICLPVRCLHGLYTGTYHCNSDVSVNYCTVRLLDFTLGFLTGIQTPSDLQTAHVIPKIEVFVFGLTLLGL